jgi:hypothetical protein
MHATMLTHLLRVHFLLRVARAPKVALFYRRTGCGDKGKIDSDGKEMAILAVVLRQLQTSEVCV